MAKGRFACFGQGHRKQDIPQDAEDTQNPKDGGLVTVLVTMFHGEHEAFRSVTEARMMSYCLLHGYEYRVAEYNDHLYHPKWQKMPALLDALEEHEVAIWMDADMAIVDPDTCPPITSFLRGWLTILYDNRYGVSSAMMAYVRSEQSEDFLNQVFGHRYDPYGGGDRDQRAIRNVLMGASAKYNGYGFFGPEWCGYEGWGPENSHMIHGCFQTAGTVLERATTLERGLIERASAK
jgi:galactosyl transferase GMA12/MNN10 family